MAYINGYSSFHPPTMGSSSSDEDLFESEPPVVVLAEPVLVGGTGGDEFILKYNTYVNHVKKIAITYTKDYDRRVTSLNSLQVVFQDNQKIKVGKFEGNNEQVFTFNHGDKVVSAKLWPNVRGDRFAGVEFVVEKYGGAETMRLKCDEVGAPVTDNTMTGTLCGVKGRSGHEIDALGFYFC